MRVFFDTNVVADIVSGRLGVVESARAVQKCPRADRLLSALSIANCAYIFRGLGQTGVRQMSEHLLREFTVLPLRRSELAHAVRLHGPDFEDAVQYATAERAGATMLITRDLSGFPFTGKVKILTPEQLLAL